MNKTELLKKLSEEMTEEEKHRAKLYNTRYRGIGEVLNNIDNVYKYMAKIESELYMMNGLAEDVYNEIVVKPFYKIALYLQEHSWRLFEQIVKNGEELI